MLFEYDEKTLASALPTEDDYWWFKASMDQAKTYDDAKSIADELKDTSLFIVKMIHDFDCVFSHYRVTKK